MDGSGEKSLTGGTTPGVVRIGDTVRRPPHDRWEYVHSVLRHLESVGFDGAPRLLGVDERGRDILSYVDGMVTNDAAALSDAELAGAARLIRRFHDATAGTALAAGEEVVLHGDLGPHNTVFAGERAVALIDWDDGVKPGPRVRDVGHAVWCFADIGEGGGPLGRQAHRAKVLCDAYGWADPGEVLDELTARFHRARAEHLAHGRTKAVAIFAGYIAWMDAHLPTLRTLMAAAPPGC
ncbi:MAG: phosphotransferase [Actinophytocola sp.]|uniref:phosphotransferase n=1 Tax=Actinophytocola sp. TaxID=1872138 RepID=UPI001327E853|nr:phosphotransferase [Actinophytocola sp.]MPZ84218.1 phosphotransferase [Actinophytocola sp.]